MLKQKQTITGMEAFPKPPTRSRH